MAFFSERLFYVIIVLGLTVTAIVVPIVILKQQPLAVTFFFIGPNGSGPVFVTPTPPQKQEEFTTRLGIRAGMTTTEESNTTNITGQARDFELDEKAGDMDFNASDFVTDYLGVAEMDRYFEKLARNNEPYMKKENYPNLTVHGRDIMYLKIEVHKEAQVILIVSGIGGGDWRSPLLTIFVMNYFLQANESKTFLETFSLHFIPLLNPDVYNWTRNAPPMNRSYPYNAAGVNLIRDYGTDKGSKKKLAPKQPETEFFIDNFQALIDDRKLRVIILFEALPEELEGTTEMRICLPILLKEKRNASHNYFLKRYPGYQMCEEKDYYHLSNWVVTQTPKNPVITFSLQVNYKPDVFLDNLQFMLRYGQRFYEFLQDFLLIVKDEKAGDPLGMHPKGHSKSKT